MNKNTVAVIGLGKIGLTLAAVYASNGYKVVGVDVNQNVVDTVNRGESHIQNEPGLQELVHEAYVNKQLRATASTREAVQEASTVVVIVPVLIDDDYDVDYQYIDAATREIGLGIQKGTTVIYETTLPTGDTRKRFGAMIEQASSLQAGVDFYLAYSPERVYSNTIIRDLKKYPKIVGGINEASLINASTFYKLALGCDVLPVENADTAEFAKVAECVYRDVNIALANELAIYADQMNVNMRDAAAASNTQPYSHIHAPGVGVGGHCIPIYPYFFISRGLDEGIVQQSRKKNDQMANYALERIESQSGKLQGKNVLILGLSYRENVKETEKSSAWKLLEGLKERGAASFVHDPHFSEEEMRTFNVEPLELTNEEMKKVDIIILQAYHDEYRSLDFSQFVKKPFVFDGRNVLDPTQFAELGMGFDAIGGAKQ
ncbi:nucleotide sugar dehydrogenase [Geomicrobium sp. JSM 1781026]|uniref:nucleotide sugar dehydrogenase n=1 Tax=Geomicrobium sp. JSM 1781026 TaxID=3344580 RepID=UPI0035C1E8C4